MGKPGEARRPLTAASGSRAKLGGLDDSEEKKLDITSPKSKLRWIFEEGGVVGKKEIMEGKPGDREAPHARSCTRKAGKPEAFLIFSGMPGNPEARGPG